MTWECKARDAWHCPRCEVQGCSRRRRVASSPPSPCTNAIAPDVGRSGVDIGRNDIGLGLVAVNVAARAGASAHSPWQRMAAARLLAWRIARSLDQKGVIIPSPIRMAQPCCSLTTLKVIMEKVPTQITFPLSIVRG